MIVGNIIEKKINKAIVDKYQKQYHVTIDDISVNIISGNVTLKNLKIKPDTALLARYESGTSSMSSIMDIEVPRFRLVGLSLTDAITKSIIDIKKLDFVDAKIKFYSGFKPVDTIPEIKDSVEKKFNLDSIQFSGIDGVFIEKIAVINAGFEIYNVKTNSKVIDANEIDVELEGISLDKLEGEGDYFKLVLDELKFTLIDEKLSLPGDWYYLTFGKLIYDKSASSLIIQNLKLFPQYNDLYEMAQKLVYTSEIFNISADEIEVFNFNLRQIINEKSFYADSVSVTKLDLDILKDKRFPWNFDKRPQLPNHQLRLMTFPLYIGQVNIKNSRLYYHEIVPDSDEQMAVSLDDLDVKIGFITSVKDSIATGKPMTINLKSNLMKVAPLRADFILQLNSKYDNFSFSGHLGKADLSIFNPALKPAAGMIIQNGVVDMVTFSATANNTLSIGKMTMVYSGLVAEALKKNEKDKGKFMSFLANTVVHSSNPNKREKLRIAQMGFERVEYKGFGNFVWKTLQTGIVNTVLPTGKSEKQVKEVAKTAEKQTRQERKEEKKKK
ncbi:MAG TPA: hypothetical protein VIN10_14325 [Bacteroidales bacterium]